MLRWVGTWTSVKSEKLQSKFIDKWEIQQKQRLWDFFAVSASLAHHINDEYHPALQPVQVDLWACGKPCYSAALFALAVAHRQPQSPGSAVTERTFAGWFTRTGIVEPAARWSHVLIPPFLVKASRSLSGDDCILRLHLTSRMKVEVRFSVLLGPCAPRLKAVDLSNVAMLTSCVVKDSVSPWLA